MSAEKEIHNSINELIQSIYDTHGIMIMNANIRWLDIGTIEGSCERVSELRIDSTTKYPIKRGNVGIEPIIPQPQSFKRTL